MSNAVNMHVDFWRAKNKISSPETSKSFSLKFKAFTAQKGDAKAQATYSSSWFEMWCPLRDTLLSPNGMTAFFRGSTAANLFS
mmetsp:Transcript_19773/g.48349  ORF Transcript_19773/g.48349 Transcript_19773/m.48349 type:complete len:83 (-) Transcript_19773:2071-2319(-)